MIFKYERKFLEWLTAHLHLIVFLAATFISFVIRFSLRNINNADTINCLIPWFYSIKENGGIFGLGTPVEGLNYSFTYQFFIAIFTYLPIDPLYSYKIFSCIFDYLLAVAVAYFIYNSFDRHKTELALLAFIIVTCSPVVFFNSAGWGQCDAIYTFWVIAAILCLTKDKYLSAFILYGVAFAFKFQAVFFLPFFMFYYFYKKKFSIIHFGIIDIAHAMATFCF